MPRRHVAYALQVRFSGTREIQTLHHDTDWFFVLQLYQHVSRSSLYRNADVWLMGFGAASPTRPESVIYHRHPRRAAHSPHPVSQHNRNPSTPASPV